MHVMLDLETLGTRPGCKILSISAVTFGSNRRFYFDVFVKIDSQPLLVTDEDTYNWWHTNDPELVKFTLHNDHAVPLAQALYMFSEWYKALPGEPTIWGNGATFDPPVLRAAYEYLGIETPWNFRKERCFRTFKEEVAKPLGVEAPKFCGEPHRGLHDATFQADWAQAVMDKIKAISDSLKV